MQLEKLKKTRLYEEIVKQLQGLIKDGTLKPGDKLPTESELSDMLGVSRTAIREARRSLELMGFLESKVGEGTYIRQITMNNVIDPFFSVLTQDEKQILDLYETRLILEVEIARLAAKRATPEKIKKIESIVNMEEGYEQGGVSLNTDNAFHNEIAYVSDNKVLIDIVSLCSNMLSKVRQSTLGIKDSSKKAKADHQKIFEAIRDGRDDDAANAMRDHILYFQNLYKTKKLKK